MLRTFIALAAGCSLILLSGCSRVWSIKAAPGFRLTEISGQRVAVSPVGRVVMDKNARKVALNESGSEEAFSLAFSARLSRSCIQALGAGQSFDSGQLAEALKGNEGKPTPEFPMDEQGVIEVGRRLLAVGELSSVRFLIVPKELTVDRNWLPMLGDVYAIPFPHAETYSRLDVAVLDLESNQVVWTGHVYATVFSTWHPAEAMMELADSLCRNFAASAR